MQPFRTHTLFLALTLFAASPRLSAQPPFEIPLTVTDGVDIDTLYFGILLGGHYCIDQRDTINGHVEFIIPAVPLSGVFYTRLVYARNGIDPGCFEQGGPYDFRPFTSILQLDTFRVWSQLGMGTTMVLSWPANLGTLFSQMTLRYFDQIAVNNVNVNMLTNTSADVTNAGDPAVVRIFAGEQPMSVEQASRDMPERLELDQNYPNPFNPSTIIQFRLPISGFVGLSVYDVLGRKVTSLLDGERPAGEHRVEWQPEGISSGIYTYRLTAPNAAITRRMFYLK